MTRRERQVEFLLERLGTIRVEKHALRNLSELMYTASENGLIYEGDDDTEMMARLVLLALKYGKDGIPDLLRM